MKAYKDDATAAPIRLWHTPPLTIHLHIDSRRPVTTSAETRDPQEAIRVFDPTHARRWRDQTESSKSHKKWLL